MEAAVSSADMIRFGFQCNSNDGIALWSGPGLLRDNVRDQAVVAVFAEKLSRNF